VVQVVGSGVREERSSRCRPINEAEIKPYSYVHSLTYELCSDAVVKVGV
jgi:hypothetical protein